MLLREGRSAAGLFGCFVAVGCLVAPAQAAVIVDDTWADGNRTSTALPTDCAWYAQVASSLVASPGSMTGTANPTSSRLWLTYFTTSPSEPVVVPVGEMLKLTLQFVPASMNSGTNSRGVRIGLFDSSAGARIEGDFNSSTAVSGTGVTGYMLGLNFSPVFSNAPIQIWNRSDVANANLMGTTAAFTLLGEGGGMAGDPGFQSDNLYVLELTVMRQTNSVEIAAGFSSPGNPAWSVSHSLTNTDANPVFRFDTFAVRWERPEQTAASVRFTRFKVEVGPPAPPPPPPFRITSIERVPPENLRFNWDSIPGRTYEIQVLEDIGQTNWTGVGTVTANQTASSFTDFSILSVPQRFYRVVELP